MENNEVIQGQPKESALDNQEQPRQPNQEQLPRLQVNAAALRLLDSTTSLVTGYNPEKILSQGENEISSYHIPIHDEMGREHFCYVELTRDKKGETTGAAITVMAFGAKGGAAENRFTDIRYREGANSSIAFSSESIDVKDKPDPNTQDTVDKSRKMIEEIINAIGKEIPSTMSRELSEIVPLTTEPAEKRDDKAEGVSLKEAEDILRRNIDRLLYKEDSYYKQSNTYHAGKIAAYLGDPKLVRKAIDSFPYKYDINIEELIRLLDDSKTAKWAVDKMQQTDDISFYKVAAMASDLESEKVLRILESPTSFLEIYRIYNPEYHQPISRMLISHPDVLPKLIQEKYKDNYYIQWKLTRLAQQPVGERLALQALTQLQQQGQSLDHSLKIAEIAASLNDYETASESLSSYLQSEQYKSVLSNEQSNPKSYEYINRQVTYLALQIHDFETARDRLGTSFDERNKGLIKTMIENDPASRQWISNSILKPDTVKSYDNFVLALNDPEMTQQYINLCIDSGTPEIAAFIYLNIGDFQKAKSLFENCRDKVNWNSSEKYQRYYAELQYAFDDLSSLCAPAKENDGQLETYAAELLAKRLRREKASLTK